MAAEAASPMLGSTLFGDFGKQRDVVRRDTDGTLVGGGSSDSDSLGGRLSPSASPVSVAVPDLEGNLNEVQRDALRRLRALLDESPHGSTFQRHQKNPYETVEHLLLRFLRARSYNVSAAWQMLKADLDWREENDIASLTSRSPDDVLGCPVGVMFEQMPIWVQGFDRKGRPVVYRGFGHTWVSRVLERTTLDGMLNYHTYLNEVFCEALGPASEKAGHLVDTFTFVVDARGWHVGLATKAAYGFLRGMSVSDAAHYPERLGRIVVINSPFLIHTAWRIISAWLDPVTRAKVSIVSEKDTKAVLDELIAPEELIDDYGGKARSQRPLDPNGKPYW
ncbi:CRAL-TRIO domain-containing protein [Hyaloraphidium curvatum]|nr:CRAL-TRIO domain-containing protein [Hyaloraphidium curvatum]